MSAVAETLSGSEVEAQVDRVLESRGDIQRLMQALEQVGCPVGRKFFKVATCDTTTGGGFSPSHGVILCHNHLHTQKEVENTLLHELIHAYDYCRPCGTDFSNCRQHAISEVRAAHLSGDCAFMQELLRGNLELSHLTPNGWAAQHHRCIKRRAALSAALNPDCTSPDHAAAVVNEVFGTAMADRSPLA